MSRKSACRIICTGRSGNGSMVGAFPLCPFKSGAMGSEVSFHHWCSSRKIFGARRIFSRISPNLPESFFVQLLPTKFLAQRLRPFFSVASKKGFHVFFCKPWHFYPDFQQIKRFVGTPAPTAPPPATQLLFITVP